MPNTDINLSPAAKERLSHDYANFYQQLPDNDEIDVIRAVAKQTHVFADYLANKAEAAIHCADEAKAHAAESDAARNEAEYADKDAKTETEVAREEAEAAAIAETIRVACEDAVVMRAGLAAQIIGLSLVDAVQAELAVLKIEAKAKALGAWTKALAAENTANIMPLARQAKNEATAAQARFEQRLEQFQLLKHRDGHHIMSFLALAQNNISPAVKKYLIEDFFRAYQNEQNNDAAVIHKVALFAAATLEHLRRTAAFARDCAQEALACAEQSEEARNEAVLAEADAQALTANEDNAKEVHHFAKTIAAIYNDAIAARAELSTTQIGLSLEDAAQAELAVLHKEVKAKELLAYIKALVAKHAIATAAENTDSMIDLASQAEAMYIQKHAQLQSLSPRANAQGHLFFKPVVLSWGLGSIGIIVACFLAQFSGKTMTDLAVLITLTGMVI